MATVGGAVRMSSDPGAGRLCRSNVARRATSGPLGAVVLIVLGMGPASAGSEVEDQVRRLAGPSRIETAVAISRDDFSGQVAGTVVIARADVAADALAGGWFAGSSVGPMLLAERDRVPEGTRAEIDRVLVRGRDVFLLGGPAALSPAIEEQLRDHRVHRLQGRDRFETAVAIAERRDDAGGPRQIVLADGTRHQDAVIAGPAAMEANGVVLLTNGSRSHPAVDDYLHRHPDVPVVTVGAAATAAYPGHTSYVGESDAETAALVAEAYVPPHPTNIGVARVDDFADALAAGPHIARRLSAILLTDRDALSEPADAYLRLRTRQFHTGVVYGGEDALSRHVEQAVLEAIS